MAQIDRMSLANPTSANATALRVKAIQLRQNVAQQKLATVHNSLWKQSLDDCFPDVGYPYASVQSWLWAKRLASIAPDGLTPEKAQEIVSQYEEKAGDQLTTAWAKVKKSTDFDAWSQQALQTGLLVAGIGGAVGGAIGIGVAVGAAAGSTIPLVGTLIGAAVGFVVGVCIAIIPLDKWDVMNKFHDLSSKLKPVERFMLWGSARKAIDNARKLEKKEPLPPWWLKTPELYTIYGGIDSVATFCFEDLARQECFAVKTPLPAGKEKDLGYWDPVALYGCAVICSHAGPTQLVKDSQFYRENGSPSLAPYLEVIKDWTTTDVRNEAIKHGLADFPSIPITPTVTQALEAREAQLGAG